MTGRLRIKGETVFEKTTHFVQIAAIFRNGRDIQRKQDHAPRVLMSVAPNLCCDETKNRGTYTRVTI